MLTFLLCSRTINTLQGSLSPWVCLRNGERSPWVEAALAVRRGSPGGVKGTARQGNAWGGTHGEADSVRARRGSSGGGVAHAHSGSPNSQRSDAHRFATPSTVPTPLRKLERPPTSPALSVPRCKGLAPPAVTVRDTPAPDGTGLAETAPVQPTRTPGSAFSDARELSRV